MISQLTFVAQNRKSKLVTYLNNYNDELPLEKQHQLYGAITELDSIIETLANLRSKEIRQERNPNEIFLFRPIHSKGILSNIKNFIKDLF